MSDPGPLNKYEYVSFTKVMRLDPVTDTWSTVFMVTTLTNHMISHLVMIR